MRFAGGQLALAAKLKFLTLGPQGVAMQLPYISKHRHTGVRANGRDRKMQGLWRVPWKQRMGKGRTPGGEEGSPYGKKKDPRVKAS